MSRKFKVSFIFIGGVSISAIIEHENNDEDQLEELALKSIEGNMSLQVPASEVRAVLVVPLDVKKEEN